MKDGKDQGTIQSSTTPEPGYHMGNINTINITNKSQEVSHFPAGDRKAAMNRCENMRTQGINNTNDPQKKNRLGTVSKNSLLEALNWFHCAPTTPLVQMWIKAYRCLVCMKVP